ncbi:MAG: hypothetical protein JW953_01440 [Anaerolineae bacterium]|nr:hypothetical protein [Anaerolineae bacterium]
MLEIVLSWDPECGFSRKDLERRLRELGPADGKFLNVIQTRSRGMMMVCTDDWTAPPDELEEQVWRQLRAALQD